jgi:hypothetical protein
MIEKLLRKFRYVRELESRIEYLENRDPNTIKLCTLRKGEVVENITFQAFDMPEGLLTVEVGGNCDIEAYTKGEL